MLKLSSFPFFFRSHHIQPNSCKELLARKVVSSSPSTHLAVGQSPSFLAGNVFSCPNGVHVKPSVLKKACTGYKNCMDVCCSTTCEVYWSEHAPHAYCSSEPLLPFKNGNVSPNLECTRRSCPSACCREVIILMSVEYSAYLPIFRCFFGWFR